MLAWEEAQDIFRIRRKWKLDAEVVAGAPMLSADEIKNVEVVFLGAYMYTAIPSQDVQPTKSLD